MKGQMIVKKILKAAALTGGALCIIKGLDNRLEVTHYNISSKKIPPAFDGFKIVQVSDYHCDSIPGLVGEVQREEPDLIVSTGDLVDDDGSYLPGVRLCEHLIDIAPVYAVTGNHDLWRSDYEEFEKEISDIGVVTLHNERVIIEIDGQELGLAGIDDPFTLNGSKAVENIQTFLAKLKRYDGFDILLFHRANLFESVSNQGFDLVLAGHMHGGQVRFPNGKGLVSPRSNWASKASVFFPKYVGGHYKTPHTEMLVSRGIGNPMFIPRLFNRPEILSIMLKSEQ